MVALNRSAHGNMGMTELNYLWPELRELFYKDLKELHKCCGPWDLVLFSGDLVQKGSAKEFEKVESMLKSYGSTSNLSAHNRS